MNNEVKEQMAEALTRELDEAMQLPPGSEERARAYKNVKIIWDALTDEFKFGEELMDVRVRLEKELELKEEEIKNEKKRRWDRLRDTMLIIVTIVGTSIFGAVMEVNGWRLPKWLTHFDKLWKFLKN